MSTPTRSSYSSSDRPRWSRMWPRFYRLTLLLAVAWLVHWQNFQPVPPDVVTLADARMFFPAAAGLAEGERRLGGQTVVDSQGRALGLVLTTSPHADEIIGYAGPSNLLIALDLQQRVIGARLLSSGDTQAHVEQVRGDQSFFRQFAGWKRQQPRGKIEGVSGSTLTSLAMAEAIERRLGSPVTSLRFPEPVTLKEVRVLFPEADAFQGDDPRVGWNRVLDRRGELLGFAVRTSPFTDNGRGYQGPTESLVAVASDGERVVGVVVRSSYDTPEYVERVREDDEFLRLLTGRSIKEWAELDFRQAGIEGVSGATQTSFAVADGLKRRFAADRQALAAKPTATKWSFGLLAIIIGALAMTFTPLRASRRLRWVWQGVLIVAFLLWLGDLLSLALLAGWARNGIPWQAAPSVALLAAVAMVVPWVSGRQIYCQQICPHGAAQAWLARFKRFHWRMPPNATRWLTRLRTAIAFTGIGIALFWQQFDLAWLEPFDGWVLKAAAAVSLGIAVIGLAASVAVPQAYCRFGCPTGELLAILKSRGKQDRLNGRDWAAGGLLVLASFAAIVSPLRRSVAPVEATLSESKAQEIRGKAFGTTWSVKVRGNHDVDALKPVIDRELERIESTLSHWRPESLTAQFNASETTLALEQPRELMDLVARAQELSRLTGGAYDITVAPLVDAWGFGPSGQKKVAPNEAEIQGLLERVGWQKLTVETSDNTLRKAHPLLQIDLGSVLQGHAADRVGQILEVAGVTEFLVEVGGELLARGAWKVTIEDPRDASQSLCTVTLRNQALATSGFYRATSELNGVPAHHLLSPQTGKPVSATALLAAVVAPSAVEADARATALLAVGMAEGSRLAEEQGLTALLVDLQHQQKVSEKGARVFASQ